MLGFLYLINSAEYSQGEMLNAFLSDEDSAINPPS
jgi:hypothetical protein